MPKLETEILRILRASEGHLTSAQALALCEQQGVRASVASVYRVLAKLADEGLIRRYEIPGGPDVFDKTITEHEHLVCARCGAISDFRIENLAQLIEQETGIKPDSFELSAKYVCEQCRAAEPAAKGK